MLELSIGIISQLSHVSEPQCLHWTVLKIREKYRSMMHLACDQIDTTGTFITVTVITATATALPSLPKERERFS